MAFYTRRKLTLKAERLEISEMGLAVKKDFLSIELNRPPPTGIPVARNNPFSPLGNLILLEILEIWANECSTGGLAPRASGGVGQDSIGEEFAESGTRFRTNS